MVLLQIQKKTELEKRILEIEEDYKTALPLAKQFLEGQLSILKELETKGGTL